MKQNKAGQMTRELLVTDRLEGKNLDAANRVLSFYGVPEIKSPCTVIDVMNHMSPMEAGRFSHILHEIAEAFEGSEEVEDDDTI